MQEDIQKILLSVLEIIDYKEDRDKYVQQFLGMSLLRALDKSLKTLPSDQKEKLKDELKADMSQEDIAGLIKKFSQNPDFQKILAEASAELLDEFVKAVEPTLSEDQKEKLNTYLSSLQDQ